MVLRNVLKSVVWLVVFIFFTAIMVHAKMYKWVDENGTAHFSDTLPPTKKFSVQKEAIRKKHSNHYSDLTPDDVIFLKKLYTFLNEEALTEAELNKLIKGHTNEEVNILKSNYGKDFDISLANKPPNPNMVSPEQTWHYYKSSLIKGDIESALACFTLREAKKQKKFYKAMGSEKLKELGNRMRSIQKITQDKHRAKYRIKRNHQGQDITYYIYFSNIFGNWKIAMF